MENLLIEWHTGHPPHVGWWQAGFYKCNDIWRWWDGRKWSMPVSEEMTPVEAGVYANSESCNQPGILWTKYWPENARVPRRNPNHFL